MCLCYVMCSTAVLCIFSTSMWRNLSTSLLRQRTTIICWWVSFTLSVEVGLLNGNLMVKICWLKMKSEKTTCYVQFRSHVLCWPISVKGWKMRVVFANKWVNTIWIIQLSHNVHNVRYSLIQMICTENIIKKISIFSFQWSKSVTKEYVKWNSWWLEMKFSKYLTLFLIIFLKTTRIQLIRSSVANFNNK